MDLLVLKIDVFAGCVGDAIEIAEDEGYRSDVRVGFLVRVQKAEDGADGLDKDGGCVGRAKEILSTYRGKVTDLEED